MENFKKLIRFDMYLNISLGVFLTAFFDLTLKLIFVPQFEFEPILITVLGITLFLFGLWQAYLFNKDGFTKKVMKFLGYMALLPAAALLMFTFLYYSSLTYLGLVLFLIGTFYMFVLGYLYFKNA